ncbi:MAG: nicotinate phosphoribosyltransferase [Spirochaetota bacterium]
MFRREDLGLASGILFTDQYQLTMAQLYFRQGLHEREAQFDHFFRKTPDYGTHRAGYCVNAGLEWLVSWMREARFGEREIELLRSQRGGGEQPLFSEDFLSWLRKNGNFEGISLRSVPEGRVVYPTVPLAVIQGPLAMAQVLETALLNKLNYHILVATKASLVREMCGDRLAVEFGARRAQDLGALAAARAALIGGMDFTSNSGISLALGYPPKGTHAHSMVQLFMALGMSELEAFRSFAEVYPDDCILLVDTLDTLQSGVPNAITVLRELKAQGHRPVGIRLDSGDLTTLSIRASEMLDRAGLEEVSIVLSNELDEWRIHNIIERIKREAPGMGVEPDRVIGRLSYGVGTRLVTSAGEAALGGVYKLTAVRHHGGWTPAIKISESREKVPNPGDKDAWRVYDRSGTAMGDLMGLRGENPEEHRDELVLCHPVDGTEVQAACSELEPLLEQVLDRGRLVYRFPSLEEIRERRKADLQRLPRRYRKLENPAPYPVHLTTRLRDLKEDMISSIRNSTG